MPGMSAPVESWPIRHQSTDITGQSRSTAVLQLALGEGLSVPGVRELFSQAATRLHCGAFL